MHWCIKTVCLVHAFGQKTQALHPASICRITSFLWLPSRSILSDFRHLLDFLCTIFMFNIKINFIDKGLLVVCILTCRSIYSALPAFVQPSPAIAWLVGFASWIWIWGMTETVKFFFASLLGCCSVSAVRLLPWLALSNHNHPVFLWVKIWQHALCY